MSYSSHSDQPGEENCMKNINSRPSILRTVVGMVCTWSVLGAMVGAVDGLGGGGSIQIISMIIGGMIALSIPGAVLGLIGGDAKGSVAGAAAGLLGCCVGGSFGGAAFQSELMKVTAIAGALLGATGFLCARLLVWECSMAFRTARWVAGIIALPTSSTLPGHDSIRNPRSGR
jgi:hypothetical protein